MTADETRWTSPPLPQADDVQRALQRVYGAGDYDLAPPAPDQGGVEEFFRPLRERLWDPLVAWWKELAGAVPWGDEVLAGVVLCGIAALLWRMLRLRPTEPTPDLRTKMSVATRPEEVHMLALKAGERGEYAAAARLLLQAGVLRLEAAERRVNRPGVTNRELLRRYRGTRLAGPVSTLVETIDRGWFGRQVCTRRDYDECLAAHDEIAAAANPRVATAGGSGR